MNKKSLDDLANDYFEMYVMEEVITDNEEPLNPKKIKMDTMEFISQIRCTYKMAYRDGRYKGLLEVLGLFVKWNLSESRNPDDFIKQLKELNEDKQ